MTFKEEHLYGVKDPETGEKTKAIVTDSTKLSKGDRSKEDKDKIFTSDETLYEISMRKKRISNSILKAIKETSVDCSVYSTANAREGIACYSFGNPSPDTFTGGPSYTLKKNNLLDKLILKVKFGEVLQLILDLHMVKLLLNLQLKILKINLKKELEKFIH